MINFDHIINVNTLPLVYSVAFHSLSHPFFFLIHFVHTCMYMVTPECAENVRHSCYLESKTSALTSRNSITNSLNTTYR